MSKDAFDPFNPNSFPHLTPEAYKSMIDGIIFHENLHKEYNMAKQVSAKKQEKIDDARIEKQYGLRCGGIQIDIMDISKVFREGQKAIDNGADDATLGQAIFDFVQTIRKN